MKSRKPKKRRIFRYVILLAIVFVVFNIAANKIASTKYEKMSQTDRQMFSEIIKVYDSFEKSSKDIWTENYRLDKIPVVLSGYNMIFKGNTYVLNVNLSNKIYAKKVTLPKEICGGQVYRVSNLALSMLRLWNPMFHEGTIKVNKTDILALKYNKKSLKSGDFSKTLTYNGFLDYQKKNNGLLPPNQKDKSFESSLNYALKGVEYSIIGDMLSCQTESELSPYILKFVAVRELRYKDNQSLSEYETKCEMSNGAARYSAFKLTRLIGELQKSTSFKEKYKNNIASKEKAEYFIKDSATDSGVALGLILDKLPISSGWRSAIENSSKDSIVSQYSILKDYCNKYIGDYKAVNIENVKKEYDFDTFKAQSEDLLQTEMKSKGN